MGLAGRSEVAGTELVVFLRFAQHHVEDQEDRQAAHEKIRKSDPVVFSQK